MKAPSWILWIIAPLSIVWLGYLILCPHPLENPSLNESITVIVIDPVKDGLFFQMLKSNELPVFSTLISNGILGNLEPRQAVNMYQAWQEILTGKDASKIAASCIHFDPATYQIVPNSFSLSKQSANLLNIAQCNNKISALYLDSHSVEFNKIKNNELSIIHFEKSTESDTEYLTRCNEFLKRLLEHPDKVCTFIISPGSVPENQRVFLINLWLQNHGYLSTKNQQIDWDNTQAFCLDSADRGIRIHRQDIYPRGTVSRESFIEFRKSLFNHLKSIVDPQTKTELFASIYSGENFFPSQLQFHYPDFVLKTPGGDSPVQLCTSLEWNYPADRLTDNSKKYYSMIQDRKTENQIFSANGGWIILNGTPFLENKHLDNLLGIDVTPTVLFLLDLPVAEEMNGRVILTSLKKEWLQITKKTIPSYERIDSRVNQSINP